MLNHMKIQGFKCFREAEIDFSYFTLLAGKILQESLRSFRLSLLCIKIVQVHWRETI